MGRPSEDDWSSVEHGALIQPTNQTSPSYHYNHHPFGVGLGDHHHDHEIQPINHTPLLPAFVRNHQDDGFHPTHASRSG